MPVELGEDGQPIPQAVEAAAEVEPEPVVIKKKTPPPFEFKLDLPPEGAEVPFVRNCEFCCRWPVLFDVFYVENVGFSFCEIVSKWTPNFESDSPPPPEPEPVPVPEGEAPKEGEATTAEG